MQQPSCAHSCARADGQWTWLLTGLQCCGQWCCACCALPLLLLHCALPACCCISSAERCIIYWLYYGLIVLWSIAVFVILILTTSSGCQCILLVPCFGLLEWSSTALPISRWWRQEEHIQTAWLQAPKEAPAVTDGSKSSSSSGRWQAGSYLQHCAAAAMPMARQSVSLLDAALEDVAGRLR